MATGRTTIGGDWDGSVDGGKPGGHGGVTLQAEVHANDGCGRLGWRSEPRLWPRRLNRTTIHDMIAAGRCMTFSACFSPRNQRRLVGVAVGCTARKRRAVNLFPWSFPPKGIPVYLLSKLPGRLSVLSFILSIIDECKISTTKSVCRWTTGRIFTHDKSNVTQKGAGLRGTRDCHRPAVIAIAVSTIEFMR